MNQLKIMTEKQVLLRIAEYFKARNLDLRRINTIKTHGAKSPDFELFISENLAAYIEVKSPLLLLNDKTQLFQWTTSVSKLRGFIHVAVKQFTEADSQHTKPWLLVFTSDHMQLNWVNMIHALTGVVSHGGNITTDLRQERYVKDTESDVIKIDSIVWFQMNSEGKIHQVRFFVNAESKFKNECEKYIARLRPREGDRAYKR